MANNPPGGGYPPGSGGGYPGQPQYGQPQGQPAGYGPPGATPQPGGYGPPGATPQPGGYGPPPGQQPGFGQQPFGQPGQQPDFGQQPPGQPGFGQQPGGPPPGGFGAPQPGFTPQVMKPTGGGGGALKIIAMAIGGVVVVGGALGAFWYFHTHPSMYIVNVTGKDGVTVTIDGEAVAPKLKNAASESIGNVTIKSVSSGSHKVEAKDAGGKVLESFNYEVKAGSNGIVYAPARNPKVCFIVQTDEFKTSPSAPDTVKDHFKKLDPTKTIWDLPDQIDYWFSDSPTNITIKQKKGSGSSSVIKRALRQQNCDDPNFND